MTNTHDGPSRYEFQMLREQIASGFDGVNQRLDTVNGRIGKHDDRLGALERIQNRLMQMRRQIADADDAGESSDDWPQRRRTDSAGSGEEWAASFSRREYALMALGFGIVAALIKVIEVTGAALWHTVAK